MASHFGVTKAQLQHRVSYLYKMGKLTKVPKSKLLRKRKDKSTNFLGHSWSDDDDLYLMETKDTVQQQCTHLGINSRALYCHKYVMKKKGLISTVDAKDPPVPEQDRPPVDPPPAPGLVTGTVNAIKDFFKGPPELGSDVYDNKFKFGKVVAVDKGRGTVQIMFRSNGEMRHFNFDGCHRMIEAYKEAAKGGDNGSNPAGPAYANADSGHTH